MREGQRTRGCCVERESDRGRKSARDGEREGWKDISQSVILGCNPWP